MLSNDIRMERIAFIHVCLVADFLKRFYLLSCRITTWCYIWVASQSKWHFMNNPNIYWGRFMLTLRHIRKLKTNAVFLQIFKCAGSTLVELHCRFFREETEPCLFWQCSTKDSAHHIAGAQCWFVGKMSCVIHLSLVQ